MAVIGRSEHGFLVDHQRSISESVSALSLSCKEGLFALFEPHFRSSVENSCGTRQRKRKKSVKAGRTQEDIDAAICHQKVRETISTGVESLVRIGVDISHFHSGNKLIEQERAMPVPHKDTTDFAALVSDVSTAFTKWESRYLLEALIINKDKNFSSEKDLLGRMIYHMQDKPTVLCVSGQEYILPAKCTFLMSDASNLNPLVSHAQENGLYDLIVLDPPWFNKSAKRASKYSFMSLWQIKSLPVPQLLAPGALLGVWVTNKQKYLRFTKSELFPHWSVELVAEWYWVKVTRRGELVTDLDSPHKKPYEPLLIGRFQPKMDGLRKASLNLTTDSVSDQDIMESSCKQSKLDKESSPQVKRTKIDECTDDNGIEKCCFCHAGRNVTALTHEWTSSISRSVTDLNHISFSGNKNGHLDNLSQNVAFQNTSKHCLSCQKLFRSSQVDLSDNVESLSDGEEQIQSKQTLQEFAGQQESKWLCKTGADLILENCDRDAKPVNKQTGKCSESLRSKELTLEKSDVLPYHQVICSVPCKIHSRKPPLNEILSQYVPSNSLCLEMFARNLTPHWTSWGNEVLKFQSMEFFDQLPKKEEEKQNLTPN